MAYAAAASGAQAEQQQPEQSQALEQSQQLLEQPSVLELLMSQQSQLQSGIKYVASLRCVILCFPSSDQLQCCAG